jgi:N-acetyl-gamma-glutamyl-phosphate reductase
MDSVRVGIFGASGYTGYELIKLLANHERAEVVLATSQSYAGQRIRDLYPCPPALGGRGKQSDLTLVDVNEVWAESTPLSERIDAAFFCLPHGESMPMVKRVCEAGVRAIDLSADFRLQDTALYTQWYNKEHVAPELLSGAVYGLPEVYREQIAGADLVGNPGCYPTGALLALYPLARGGHLADGRIIVDSKSGVSGAGRKLRLSSHFCEVNEDFKPYGIGRAHRHLPEMEQELSAWSSGPVRVTFSPHLLPVDRGILSTIYVTLEAGWSVERLADFYREAYAKDVFVHVLPAGRLAALADAVHTNRCAISFAHAGGDDFIVASAIDNLVKGASGQGVQNMNVMFGLDEAMGLIA